MANTAFKFLFDQLQNQNSKFATDLSKALKTRIKELRTLISDAIWYLHTRSVDTEMHMLLNSIPPTKNQILKMIKLICLNRTAAKNDNNDDDDLSVSKEPLPVLKDLQSTLDELMKRSIRTHCDKNQYQNSLLSPIKMETYLFERGSKRGELLSFPYNSLL